MGSIAVEGNSFHLIDSLLEGFVIAESCSSLILFFYNVNFFKLWIRFQISEDWMDKLPGIVAKLQRFQTPFECQ